ncbi:hypothetical protein MKX03_004378 [Papaver bracteatum]|nr:hypothetical protein MKX03_004378 [Papaver bracteatum]
MALSKPCFFTHLKTPAKPHHFNNNIHHTWSAFTVTIRLITQSQPQRRPLTPISNPNPFTPKLPEHVSVLTGNRLNLPIKILKLIRENDVEEASLYTRHSISSNCRSTVYFCSECDNINAHCDCRKIDTALEHDRYLINYASFSPSKTTNIILENGLVDNSKIEQALPVKDDIFGKALDLVNKVYCEHNPPVKITVDLETFNDAIVVLRNMGEKRCNPGTVLFNNLIEQLCGNSMVAEAEELYYEMGEKGINTDEVTYVLLMDACFQRIRRMMLIGILGRFGIWVEVFFFGQMVERLDPGISCFEPMLKFRWQIGLIEEKEREEEEKEWQKAEALAKEAEEKAAAAEAANAWTKFSDGDILEVPATEVVQEVPAAAALEEVPAAEVIEDTIIGDNLGKEVKTGDKGSGEQVVAYMSGCRFNALLLIYVTILGFCYLCMIRKKNKKRKGEYAAGIGELLGIVKWNCKKLISFMIFIVLLHNF